MCAWGGTDGKEGILGGECGLESHEEQLEKLDNQEEY